MRNTLFHIGSQAFCGDLVPEDGKAQETIKTGAVSLVMPGIPVLFWLLERLCYLMRKILLHSKLRSPQRVANAEPSRKVLQRGQVDV